MGEGLGMRVEQAQAPQRFLFIDNETTLLFKGAWGDL